MGELAAIGRFYSIVRIGVSCSADRYREIVLTLTLVQISMLGVKVWTCLV